MIAIYLIAIFSFLCGVSTTLLLLVAIEKRALERPGGRTEIAKHLLRDEAADRRWRAWCAAHPGSPSDDDSYLDIHQWGRS